jgi:hypothetical protein
VVTTPLLEALPAVAKVASEALTTIPPSPPVTTRAAVTEVVTIPPSAARLVVPKVVSVAALTTLMVAQATKVVLAASAVIAPLILMEALAVPKEAPVALEMTTPTPTAAGTREAPAALALVTREVALVVTATTALILMEALAVPREAPVDLELVTRVAALVVTATTIRTHTVALAVAALARWVASWTKLKVSIWIYHVSHPCILTERCRSRRQGQEPWRQQQQ